MAESSATNYLFGDLEVGEHVRLREPYVVTNHLILHIGEITQINWARRSHTYDLKLEGGRSMKGVQRSLLWKLTPTEIYKLQQQQQQDAEKKQLKPKISLSQHLQVESKKDNTENAISLVNDRYSYTHLLTHSLT